jgi:hypothetical protein
VAVVIAQRRTQASAAVPAFYAVVQYRKNSRFDGDAAAVLAVSATALNRQMTDR